MGSQARTVYIVDGTNYEKGARYSLRSQTKKAPIFPVEISYKEPDPTLLIEYEASLKDRHAVGPKGGRKRKKRKSTRADGTNPRAKGTNPRSKKND
jgi:hypothetical protein